MTPEQRIAQLEADLARERAISDELRAQVRSFHARFDLETSRGRGLLAQGVLLPAAGPVPMDYEHAVRVRLKTPEEREAAEQKYREDQARRAEAAREHDRQRQAIRAAKKAASRVYFIQQQGGDRLVKIGMTSRAVEARMREIQAGQECALAILASAPGGRNEESNLHHRFSTVWVSGEWFRPGDDLMTYVALVAGRGTL